MPLVVSIDVGLRHCGVGIFTGGVLTQGALVRSPEKKVRGPAAWEAMAKAVVAWVNRGSATEVIPDVLAVETMPVYRHDGLQKRRDLLQIQGVAGFLCGRLWAASYVGYEPREWKGTVKKDVMCGRIEKRLTPGELKTLEPCPASLRHNLLDGIGVGLFWLGRL